MKKVSMLVFAVFVLSVSHIRAQGIHLGVKAGTNLSEINSRSFDNGFQWGFSAGAFAELNFTSKWGLQPELLFSQTNTQTANNFNDIYLNGINSQNVSLNYMTIPVLISWKPIPLLSFQLGPQFGILMNTSETITGNGANAFKSGEFAVVGGAQVNLGGFVAGARYVSGVTDINNVTSADTWKSENIQLYIGLRIF
jgi:hypothetical protein